MVNLLSKIASITFLSLWLATPVLAQHEMSNVSGTIVHDGYRVKWSAPKINASHKTSFGFLKRPTVVLYMPGSQTPIRVTSQRMKIDPLSQNYTFEKNVVVTLPNGILKTNFLNFNAARLEINSFDRYTYETKTEKFEGRAIHGLAKNKTLTLFGIGAHASKVDVPLL